MNKIVERSLGKIGRLPGLSRILRQEGFYRTLKRIPGATALYGNGWDATHPFDRDHGTDTSGFVSSESLRAHGRTEGHFYAGSQPSIVRTALASLPALNACTFLDLGCGKGRPLLVASEFPFQEIIGVERSPELAEIAKQNAELFQRLFPGRTSIRIIEGDASAFPMPPGDFVVFLYNPFGLSVIEPIIRRIEAALTEAPRCVYVVYYNPMAAKAFDGSSAFSRRSVRMLAYGPTEIGYGPDDGDVVAIWQSGLAPAPPQATDAEIALIENDSQPLDGFHATATGAGKK